MIRQSAVGNSLHLSWRPPKFTNGHINGYVIQYTTNRRAHDRDWFVEAVVGDGTKATIRNLLPNTKYYFKMSARNTKGNVGLLNPFIFISNAMIFSLHGPKTKNVILNTLMSTKVFVVILFQNQKRTALLLLFVN